MNLKGFFVDALSTALDNGIASPDDVLRHVGPHTLAEHLPRPLWARLLTACLGASKVDAQLVIETIGVPNLCEHVPTDMIWAVIAEVAQRSLGREFVPMTPTMSSSSSSMSSMSMSSMSMSSSIPSSSSSSSRSAPLAMMAPPAENPREPIAARPAALGPSIPEYSSTPASSSPDSLADVVAALEADERSPAPTRARTPTAQRFRQSNTGLGRLAANNSRRPQAPVEPPIASGPPGPPPGRTQRRGSTEVSELDIETEVGKEDWKSALAVEDEQLVDWSASEETQAGGDEYNNRKR